MSLIGKMAKYIVRNRFWFLLSMLTLVISTLINIYIPLLSGQVINDILKMGDLALLISLVAQILVLTGALGLVSIAQNYTSGFFSHRVVYQLRNDVFRAIQEQSFGFFDKMKTGQLMSRVTTDIERIRGFVGVQFRMILESSLLLIGIFSSMTLIDPQLTLLSFTVIPVIMVSYFYYGKKIRPLTQISREQFGKLTSIVWENLTGVKVVRSFANENYEQQKFEETNLSYYDIIMKTVKLTAFRVNRSVVLGVAIAGLYWLGGLQIMEGGLTIDKLFIFSSYLQMMVRPISLIGAIWGDYQRMAAAAERVFEILDAVPAIVDKPGALSLTSLKGNVIFENVSFGYEKNRMILKNVSLEAKPGEIIALLGPTGSGKSTIIQLLPRFYDPDSGRILVDGHDIRDVKSQDLRKHIGIVSQEIFLFNRTIRENITYGRPDASMDDVEMAARIAKADDFIKKLPDGYDTLVGERGVTLSGGQQQRVAIARALLKNPRILILDDSTSSVDVDTEYEIQQALRALLKNRTTFMVTQRISTIRDADKILVLDNGSIIEEGNHETLIAKKGAYYRIYHTLYEAQKETQKPHSDHAEQPYEKKTASRQISEER